MDFSANYPGRELCGSGKSLGAEIKEHFIISTTVPQNFAAAVGLQRASLQTQFDAVVAAVTANPAVAGANNPIIATVRNTLTK